jgi:SAM-dependent methyltransferase
MSTRTGAVADHLFSDARLAALYDLFYEGRNDFDFYLKLVMSAKSVLDVGCGTGALPHRARVAGHTGRLCGLDPAIGMLEQARRRSDVEWILGDLASVRWDREFDLIVMNGHAFQVRRGRRSSNCARRDALGSLRRWPLCVRNSQPVGSRMAALDFSHRR